MSKVRSLLAQQIMHILTNSLIPEIINMSNSSNSNGTKQFVFFLFLSHFNLIKVYTIVDLSNCTTISIQHNVKTLSSISVVLHNSFDN